jgi:uncharacterized RmlC-like cupin family protein
VGTVDLEEEEMTFAEYMEFVKAGKYPEDPRVPTGPTFTSRPGIIFNLAWGQFEHLALIESFEGAVRSNHYHKTDSHFMTVLSGKMHYFWRAIEGGKVQEVVVEPRQTVFTPPMVVHATFFPVHTSILALSRNVRTEKEHEADLVRMSIVDVIGGQPAVI